MRAEDIILNAIKKGEFIIDEDGQIWRHRKGKLVRAEHRTPQGYLQIRKMVNNKRYHTGAHSISKIVRGERRRRQPGQTGNYEHLRQRNIVNDPVTDRFVGKKAAGRILDGRTWDEMPEI